MSLEKRLFSVPGHGGAGQVKFCWQPGHGSHLCVAGSDRTVLIVDRTGRIVDQIKIKGACVGLGWDFDGDVLALVNDKEPSVVLWEGGSGGSSKWRQLDSGLRDPLSVMAWSNYASLLAVGTSKGNLMIFNHQTSRRIPIVGKHTRSVTSAAWSRRHLLALVSEDRTLSISNEHGDTVSVTQLKAEPSLLQFAIGRDDTVASDALDATMSLVLSKKILYLYNQSDPENPVELSFQSRYGNIVQYQWCGDGYILIGFENGYFVAISTHAKQLGTELFQSKDYKNTLSGIAMSRKMMKAASCGDNIVKVHELQRLESVWAVVSLDDERSVEAINWSDDGQLMAVGCCSGNIHVYVSSLPSLGAAHGTRVAVLSSIMEVALSDCLKKHDSVVVPLEVEPTFLAVGPQHLLVGMNNRAWIYSVGSRPEGDGVVRDREYVASVQAAALNCDYAAVLCDGQLHLHLLESDTSSPQERESRLFPGSNNKNMKITCHAITQYFLIYGTDTGSIVYFSIEDWSIIHEFRHPVSVGQLFPDFSGTKLVAIDQQYDAFMYYPVNDQIERLPKFPKLPLGVVWDSHETERNVFMTWDKSSALTFACTRYNINDKKVGYAGSTPLSEGQRPLALYNGALVVQTSGGRTTQLVLSTHMIESPTAATDRKILQNFIEKNIAIKRYRVAWRAACLLDDEHQWRHLAEACLHDLELELGISAYRQISDAASVWSLENFSGVEDVKLLYGHISSFLQLHDQAQTFFLASSEPKLALQMRCDLMHWQLAVQLASKLDAQQMAWVSRQYAAQLEYSEEYQQALHNYEVAAASRPHTGGLQEHRQVCDAGLARCSIRCGNIRKGIQIAQNSSNKILQRECAEILDKMKQYNESALLFESGGLFDKAAQTLVKLKSWDRVAQLLPRVHSLKIHSIYAKSREAEGKYAEAVAAYETAQEPENVVRLLLDKLRQPEKAVAVVKRSGSSEGARLVARFFLKISDFTSAIQFLVLSNCIEEAFTTAQSHEKMDLFADIIGENGRTEDYRSIAVHYENIGNALLAGKFFHKAGESAKAMTLLLRAAVGPQESEAVKQAIAVASESESDTLVTKLVDFLLGAGETLPKDPKYLFRLYMARKMYQEAAKTAVIISGEEQKSGSYRRARDMLFAMCQELRQRRLTVPREMAASMLLLHSYILARAHVKRQRHWHAALLLLRVAEHIAKFPTHKVQILTSAVVECHRAGLASSAFQQASSLLRDPEMRKQLDDKYRRTVEGIVRRRRQQDETQQQQQQQPHSPCPFCNHSVPSMQLECDNCRRRLPFCVVSGVHVVLHDLSHCQYCNFPALRSELLRLAESGESCPLCDGKPLDDIRHDSDVHQFSAIMGED